MKGIIAFSKKTEYGFFSKIVVEGAEDVLLGTSKVTYYFFGAKQFKEGDVLEFDLNNYIVEEQEVVVEGKNMRLKRLRRK